MECKPINKKKSLFAVFALCLTVFVVFCISAKASEPEQVIEDFEFSSTDFKASGETWSVEGETAFVSASNVAIKNVRAEGDYPDQKIKLTAGKGLFNLNTQDLNVEKDVEIVSSEGFTITTGRLNWYASNKEVSSDSLVMLTKGNITAQAIGARAKEGFSKVSLLKDPHIRFTNSSMEITCEGPLIFDETTNSATFNNNVFLVHNDRQVKADELIAYMNEQGNDIEKAVATGDVEIVQGGNTSHSDVVEYFPQGARLLMRGKPKLFLKAKNSAEALPVLDKLTKADVDTASGNKD